MHVGDTSAIVPAEKIPQNTHPYLIQMVISETHFCDIHQLYWPAEDPPTPLRINNVTLATHAQAQSIAGEFDIYIRCYYVCIRHKVVSLCPAEYVRARRMGGAETTNGVPLKICEFYQF